jgi:hypothetical protein
MVTLMAAAAAVVGCTHVGDVQLLTGGSGGCSIGGTRPMSITGVLVPDARAGTAIVVDSSDTEWGPGVAGTTVPVEWSPGFTGRWRLSGDVEILFDGEMVVTTGRRVVLDTQFSGGIIDGAFTACRGKERPPPQPDLGG